MDTQIPTEKTVGRFTYKDGCISGPKLYMEERGSKLIDEIQAGQDPIFKWTASQSPDIVTAILVRLQNDFAGWHGINQFIDSLGRTKN
ncbi:MAG TPA: hypothetical protein PKZ83_16770 [bacterium]|nr:hypothetical protein [bacterium]HQJ66285.1 hypothetical protein [bacterium]